ncbi:glucan endo-1,3-beta-glucosidase 5-like [Triticum urartu]|uniref:glucan endo-1,3-beta-D-glucosidase n=1 Tax=Triticum urartu TaxID=4572 RepID=A0A8R7QG37_TRIUA|nr:glucan endo-1,3-beta-glucosidase 5-like [Triticum urartu]XP_048530541.1 glucan endo-1,3-beta-glucosidase 5-like [Triticum urartu]XP_048530542.1 glucan endo-1,3-beta-glucosidase 5-like [Triticum urartu]XP_048530543.1 glucan endo-1,3-beta-glucosidase 5-like [Triticum urartu]XP_048530544.1 glucan endo-1,3-beta-glucosidase 5-like [Triticum urartu]XP_048530588.1 glucan endo-1,3-beta-glucosidase 5-like [Triticum urartu]XP_048530589.1 glucan endo-1,3-beta-glucosidase 5-like [Triticum urartu]XP_0
MGVAGGSGCVAKAAAVAVVVLCMARWSAGGMGVNWGTQLSHPLPASTVVRLLKDNGFDRVKLFDAEDGILGALKGSGIQVMVGIPNDMLSDLAGSTKAAERWVTANVSKHVNDGVDIRLVAVGNEPFLQTFNGTYLNTTFPAMQNIQAALMAAGLGGQVKVTVALNADVYQSATGKPSDGDFRADIHGLMLDIVQFLASSGAPFVANVYPFISLYADPNFPLDYAFFQGSTSPVVDGGVTYQNTFDANHDTLVAALRRNGFPNVTVVVGEVGWPTDGDANANPAYAQRFNQGLLDHVASGKGTPLTPGAPVDAYLFSLIDEDRKSIQPGNFERHWGIFFYDGKPKYQLSLRGNGGGMLVPARGVEYLQRRWCVLKPGADLGDQKVGDSVSYACGSADCTSLGYKTSCGGLDAKGNVSYAFNSYYQTEDQDDRACDFRGLATTTTVDPSTGTCRFIVGIAPTSAATRNVAARAAAVLFAVLLAGVF